MKSPPWPLTATAIALALCTCLATGHILRSSGRASFPAANGRIAFVTSIPGGTLDIYTMNPDGSAITNLTMTPNVNEGNPSWSPDGTKIAFDSHFDCDIFVMSADGTGIVNLTQASDVCSHEPAWSPDGSKIAHRCHLAIGDPGEICVMNLEGSQQSAITNNTWIDTSPAWSPDGSRIAFRSDQHGEGGEIYVIDPDGGNPVNLTNHPAGDAEPAWSPDGLSIAFARSFEVYAMNSDGSGQRNLSNYPPGADFAPEWSPDGANIVFVSGRGGDLFYYIMVMGADGSNQTVLCRGQGHQGDPSWQPLQSLSTPVAGAACPAGLQIPTPAPSPTLSPDPGPSATPVPSPLDLPGTGGNQLSSEPLGYVLIGGATTSFFGLALALAQRRRGTRKTRSR